MTFNTAILKLYNATHHPKNRNGLWLCYGTINYDSCLYVS